LTTVAWQLAKGGPATYAYEGAIFVTGAAIQWMRDGLGLITDAAETGPLAASISDTEGLFVVPAFTGLGSPWWDPYARGTIVGITRGTTNRPSVSLIEAASGPVSHHGEPSPVNAGTTKAHLARAIVEAMAYQTRDVVDAMCAASGHDVRALRADGGASVMDLLLQLQADQLQVPVARPVVQETTALGAAYLAGLAEGVWSSVDELASHWQLDAEFTPEVPAGAADAKYAQWQRAVERSRNWES
jgi:glycerol kinase